MTVYFYFISYFFFLADWWPSELKSKDFGCLRSPPYLSCQDHSQEIHTFTIELIYSTNRNTMGQSNSRHDDDVTPQGVGIPPHTENLYRSRSSRSFADITISACRRGFRCIREYLREKSRPKVENIELSPTVLSIQVWLD